MSIDNNFLMTRNGEKKEWVMDLCSCCSYTDPDNNFHKFEIFQSICCANAIYGKSFSRLNRESTCCLDMGMQGLCLCCIQIPISIYHPMGAVCIMGLLSNCLRKQVIATYNVSEQNACDDGYTCCCSHDLCNEFHYGCNYPCSLFQMLNSMREWDTQLEQNTRK